jgi:hypothetical protein
MLASFKNKAKGALNKVKSQVTESIESSTTPVTNNAEPTPTVLPNVNVKSHLRRCTCNSEELNERVEELKNFKRGSTERRFLEILTKLVEEEYPKCECNLNTTKEILMYDLLKEFKDVKVKYNNKNVSFGETPTAKALKKELEELLKIKEEASGSEAETKEGGKRKTRSKKSRKGRKSRSKK